MACKYEGCNEPVNSPHDDEFCVFHAPADRKGIGFKVFNSLIFSKISKISRHNIQEQNIDKKENYNFDGYIFPDDIVFRDRGLSDGNPLVFDGPAFFNEAKFYGRADFSKVQFNDTCFLGGTYFAKDAVFYQTKFLGKTYFLNSEYDAHTDFHDAEFHKEVLLHSISFKSNCYFEGVLFKKNASFSSSYFKELVSFGDSKFQGTSSFENCKFENDAYFKGVDFISLISFTAAEFSEVADFRNSVFHYLADFSSVIFRGKTYFINVILKWGATFNLGKFFSSFIFNDNLISGRISFTQVSFEDNAILHFNNPHFKILENSKIKEEQLLKRIKVIFEYIRFKPNAMFFENIHFNSNSNPMFLFRYCQLNDVYFTDADMILFSFYKSNFDKAHFISSPWRSETDHILKFPYTRKCIFSEEKILTMLKHSLLDIKNSQRTKSEFKIKGNIGYEDVSALYRRMKTALDNTKDYQQASWFYFNEFEMKRKALQEHYEKVLQEKVVISETSFNLFAHYTRKLFSKLSLYNSYKTFAGYGEKPMWSFLWFLIGILGFTTVNYCIGLKKGIIQDGGTIDYFDASFWDSLIFTLYRIIPTNYLPYKQIFDIPHNFWGMFMPFLNTAVLILFIAFIGIGLKRHFRRF